MLFSGWRPDLFLCAGLFYVDHMKKVVPFFYSFAFFLFLGFNVAPCLKLVL